MKTLVTIAMQEATRHTGIARRADLAAGVARRWLNLDHVGAEIPQLLGSEGPHQHRGEVDDLHAIQRTARGASHEAGLFVLHCIPHGIRPRG